MVKLCGRLVVPGAPSVSTVDGDERALIADQQNCFWLVGIYPDVLIIVAAGRATKADPGFRAVGGTHGDDAGAVNDVRIFRVHFGDGQVAAADAAGRTAVGGCNVPGFPSVVGAVEAQTSA